MNNIRRVDLICKKDILTHKIKYTKGEIYIATVITNDDDGYDVYTIKSDTNYSKVFYLNHTDRTSTSPYIFEYFIDKLKERNEKINNILGDN